MHRTDEELAQIESVYGRIGLRDWLLSVVENMSTEEFIAVVVFQHPQAKLLLDITGIRAGVGPYEATWTNGVDQYNTINGYVKSWKADKPIFSEGTFVREIINQGFKLVPTKELVPCIERMEKMKEAARGRHDIHQ